MSDAGRRPIDLSTATGARAEPQRIGPSMSFRARLTLGLVLSAVLPLLVFGVVLLLVEVIRTGDLDPNLVRVALFVFAAAVIVAVLIAYVLTTNLTAPLKAVSRAVERASAGDLSVRVEVAGEDELARLVESHNRLAAALEQRNAELRRILLAIGETSPRDSLERLLAHATRSARAAFGMIDARIELGDPAEIPPEEDIPGEARPVRAVLALPDERLGLLLGHLPATRAWDAADQDLLELFASEVAVAIRNLELFDQVERQRLQLVELDQAKDEFLRGISHNLQTPLTSIRAYAEQMGSEQPDPRLAIIVEQSDRLYRIVRQLVATSRLESGTLRPATEVLAIAPRVRRAWDALGASSVGFELEDDAAGWLAIADPDQLDQVLWALLDNAVRYGGGTPIRARVAARPADARLAITIADQGSGVRPEDRERIFDRYERGAAGVRAEGTGLGLYVSRSLCRAMGGDLALEAPEGAVGATFTILLPGEPPATDS
ncbi:MAG TPA: ATP-binding protein [Patescibacteria group bacterium]|nr:ATP-binding protein [Patescibacteria group bacterium]